MIGFEINEERRKQSMIPGEEPMTTNMRVQQSDIELFQSLKDLNG